MKKRRIQRMPLIVGQLKRHFRGRLLEELITSSRTFPITAKVDVQCALEQLFSTRRDVKLYGLHQSYSHETMTISHLIGNEHDPVLIGPLQHEEVDIGEAMPARCLRKAVWLSRQDGTPFAVLLSSEVRYGQSGGLHIEIASPPGEAGADVSRRIFEELESLVRKNGSYRGKVISLEALDRYAGHAGAIRVHKLHTVKREQVILPEPTLELLDRNVSGFIKQRAQLHKLGMPI
jgi:hypothetical protein